MPSSRVGASPSRPEAKRSLREGTKERCAPRPSASSISRAHMVAVRPRRRPTFALSVPTGTSIDQFIHHRYPAGAAPQTCRPCLFSCKVQCAALAIAARCVGLCSAVRCPSQRTAVGMWFSCLVRLACLLGGVCLVCLFPSVRRWAEAGAVWKPGPLAGKGVENGWREDDGSPAVTVGWAWQGCCLVLAWSVWWPGQPGSVNLVWPCGQDGAVSAALYLASAECLSASCLCSWGCAACSFSCSLGSSWCFSLSATVICISPFFCLVKTITSRLMECLAWS